MLTPRFSPTAQEITYLSYASGTPRVYLFNIDTGQQEVARRFPRHDLRAALLARRQPGDHEPGARTATPTSTRWTCAPGAVQRLTNNPAIDTSPCYSPDGAQIVFNSDRGGSQQLYVMNADGGDVRAHQLRRRALRARRCGRRAATSSPSPRSTAARSTSASCGPTARGERLLTQGFLVEGPTWAPNGRVLMFFRQTADSGGARRLASSITIDLTGYNEREVLTPLDASDPAWSPLIP